MAKSKIKYVHTKWGLRRLFCMCDSERAVDHYDFVSEKVSPKSILLSSVTMLNECEKCNKYFTWVFKFSEDAKKWKKLIGIK
jgi:hypothetical protein